MKYVVDVNETTGQLQSPPVPYTGQQEQPTGVVVRGEQSISWPGFVILAVFFFGVMAMVLKSFFTVKQQTIVIVERLGKFNRLARPGLNFKIPIIDKVAGELDLRVGQMVVEVETKTLDNVFVRVPVAVQYVINPEKAYEAFYKLSSSRSQISSYVFDVVRSEVPKLKLDEVFENKESIAIEVKSKLESTMSDFGYTIVQALVTDISPDEKVRDAMNEINAQQRLRMAANEKAEAEKIITIKAAEAEAESKRLQGEGIANQRKAIVAGLEESVKSFATATKTDEKAVLNLVLMTQYFDTIKDVGTHGNTRTIFLPSTPEGMRSLSNEIRNAMMSANEVN